MIAYDQHVAARIPGYKAMLRKSWLYEASPRMGARVSEGKFFPLFIANGGRIDPSEHPDLVVVPLSLERPSTP